MYRYRHIILTLLLIVSASLQLKAQDNAATLGLRAGHNSAFGNYAAFSVEARQLLAESFAIHGGAQYSTIGKAAAEARTSYIHDFGWGHVSAEVLIAYTRLASVNSYAAGAGAGISGKWVSGRLQGHDHYREDLTYDNVRYTVVGTIKDESDAPEYLKLKVNNEGIELNWQLL